MIPTGEDDIGYALVSAKLSNGKTRVAKGGSHTTALRGRNHVQWSRTLIYSSSDPVTLMRFIKSAPSVDE